MEQFLELLEDLPINDRYKIVNDIASLIGLKATKVQYELDQQLRRCRQFKEACLRSKLDDKQTIRSFVLHVFDSLFENLWHQTVAELTENEDSKTGKCLSCDVEVFEMIKNEFWKSREHDAQYKLECLHQYMLFGERVAGPLIGYC